jgi:hypothetical protein
MGKMLCFCPIGKKTQIIQKLITTKNKIESLDNNASIMKITWTTSTEL